MTQIPGLIFQNYPKPRFLVNLVLPFFVIPPLGSFLIRALIILSKIEVINYRLDVPQIFLMILSFHGPWKLKDPSHICIIFKCIFTLL